MLSLLLVTILSGILDSFNPVALTQQFVLQGVVKKRHHILCFSVAVGMTNLLVGLLVYYGLDSFVAAFWGTLNEQFFWAIPAGELVLGTIAFIYVGYRRMGKKLNTALGGLHKEEGCCWKDADAATVQVKSVSPPALVVLGMFAELCEIPTALPYLTFIAVLISFELSLPALLGILLLYNFLFTLPLYLLYALSVKCQAKVDRVYHFLKDKLFRYGTILLPVLAGVIGVALFFHAVYLLAG